MQDIKSYFNSLTHDSDSNTFSGPVGPFYADIIPLDAGGFECEMSSDLTADCLYTTGATALEAFANAFP